MIKSETEYFQNFPNVGSMLVCAGRNLPSRANICFEAGKCRGGDD